MRSPTNAGPETTAWGDTGAYAFPGSRRVSAGTAEHAAQRGREGRPLAPAPPRVLAESGGMRGHRDRARATLGAGAALGTAVTVPSLCRLSGGRGPRRRRHTLSHGSPRCSLAAGLSDRWRSSRSPGTGRRGRTSGRTWSSREAETDAVDPSPPAAATCPHGQDHVLREFIRR